MKKLLFAAILGTIVLSCTPKSEDISVTTFNIRLDTAVDSSNAWPFRKALLSEFVVEMSPDLIGFQEVLLHQYTFLDSVLNEYDSYGTGRNDGKNSGEMVPVFYKKELYELKEKGTFWLSSQPDVPGSIGWGAVLPRIVTWVRLSVKSTGKEFCFFNTHFSHVSDSARLMSAGILVRAVDSISAGSPFIVTGDFNLEPTSPPYKILTGGKGESSLIDTYAGGNHTGPEYTFNGFRDISEGRRIDYIFVKKGTELLSYRVDRIKKDSLFISDHWPVSSEVRIKPGR